MEAVVQLESRPAYTTSGPPLARRAVQVRWTEVCQHRPPLCGVSIKIVPSYSQQQVASTRQLPRLADG